MSPQEKETMHRLVDITLGYKETAEVLSINRFGTDPNFSFTLDDSGEYYEYVRLVSIHGWDGYQGNYIGRGHAAFAALKERVDA